MVRSESPSLENTFLCDLSFHLLYIPVLSALTFAPLSVFIYAIRKKIKLQTIRYMNSSYKGKKNGCTTSKNFSLEKSSREYLPTCSNTIPIVQFDVLFTSLPSFRFIKHQWIIWTTRRRRILTVFWSTLSQWYFAFCFCIPSLSSATRSKTAASNLMVRLKSSP